MSYQVYKEYLKSYYEAMGNNKLFVVAYMSLHTGELTQHQIVTITEVVAANSVLKTEFETMVEIHDYCANSDCWINVLEVNNALAE